MRVLVASRSPDLAMILGVAGYEVVDGRPGDARDWVTTGEMPPADVLVVDLAGHDVGNPLVNLAVTGEQPVAVVTTDDGAHVRDSPMVRVVGRPLSRDAVIAAIDAMTVATGSTQREVGEPSAEVPVRPGGTAPDAAPGEQRAPGPGSYTRASYAALVEQLSDEMTLAEVCAEVCALVTDAGRADAAALLVRDGDRWRVSGGSGLRDLEHRIELDSGHWLISEMLGSVRGAVIDHSDVARQYMRNAPVASRDQLAFVTSTALQAVLVVGRGEVPFGADDLTYLKGVLDEAQPHLLHALAIRRLARALGRFRDKT